MSDIDKMADMLARAGVAQMHENFVTYDEVHLPYLGVVFTFGKHGELIYAAVRPKKRGRR